MVDAAKVKEDMYGSLEARRRRTTDDMWKLAEGKINAGEMNERERLLVLLYETKDPAQKAAVDKRIRALDKEVADQQSEKALGAVDVPLRAAKKAVSGDEEEWFGPEGKNPHLYAAGNVAMDLALDPLNFVGGGLAKLGKAGAKIPGAVASISNYIPDWYGPDAVKKAKGFAEWGIDSGTSMARHILNPASRANYAENAITSPAQQRVGRYLDDASDTRATEKGVSQVQFTSGHIPEQTRGAASEAPAAKEILKRSFIEPAAPMTPANLSESLQRHPVTALDNPGGTAPKGNSKAWDEGTQEALSKEDADTVAGFVDRLVPDTDQYVIKAPVAKETGGHHNDVVYKNPAKKALVNAFKQNMDPDGNVSPEKLGKWLKDNQAQYNKDLKEGSMRTRDGWSVHSVDDDGVWLRGGMLGSAITEGGVSWLMKVLPDGTLKGFMVDKHDFAEKLGSEAIVPGGMVAVTPSMVNNIKYIGGGKNKALTAPVRDATGKPIKEGRKIVTKDYAPNKVYRQVQHEGSKDPYKGLLRDYAGTKASASGTARETAALTGEGLLTQRAYANTQGDNE